MSTLLAALIALLAIALVSGAVLGWASLRYRVEGNPLAEQINASLPQTQCGQCGYPGCRPYAEAVAQGDAINKCIPGGAAGVAKLAELTGRPAAELAQDEKPAVVAYIREAECIGCTKCIQACPVDAIVGAPKLMHTVIAAQCTGCELCLPPCPVDCIELRPVRGGIAAWRWPEPIAIKVLA
ncbi:MAG: electron transport complex subunit RsxB [Gammaproteobacteria bacterium]|nr:electron transport complex subunit RsxB [Gammaproteobacteria bacterium]